METLRVEDRDKTLAYSPNFDIMNNQNCFAIIFSWTTEITMPSISLSLNSKDRVQIVNTRISGALHAPSF